MCYNLPYSRLKGGYKVSRGARYMYTYERAICAICLDRLSVSDVVGLDGCQHQFHPKCIVPSLQRNRRCPMCRQAPPRLGVEDNVPRVDGGAVRAQGAVVGSGVPERPGSGPAAGRRRSQRRRSLEVGNARSASRAGKSRAEASRWPMRRFAPLTELADTLCQRPQRGPNRKNSSAVTLQNMPHAPNIIWIRRRRT